MKNLQILTFLAIGLLIVMLLNIMPIAANSESNYSTSHTCDVQSFLVLGVRSSELGFRRSELGVRRRDIRCCLSTSQ